LGNENHSTRDTRETRRSAIEELKTLHEEDGPVNSVLMSREVEVGQRVRSIAEAYAYRTEGTTSTRAHVSAGWKMTENDKSRT
jgi:hypothetical protein